MKIRLTKKTLGAGTFLVLAALILTGCGSKGSVTNLTAQDFASKIKDTSITVVDVRTPAEFAAGHIANAINIDVDATTFESEIQKLDKAKTYAVYCHSGRRSGIATAAMAKDGFTSLYNLTNGFADWLANGLPSVTN